MPSSTVRDLVPRGPSAMTMRVAGERNLRESPQTNDYLHERHKETLTSTGADSCPDL